MTKPEAPQSPAQAAYDDGRREILARIRSARELSDAGVMGAGRHIEEILTTARRFVSEVDAELQESDDREISELVENALGSALGQNRHVSQALELSTSIRQAGEAIARSAAASRLLALNARIESARLSEADRMAFGVIATEVQELSQKIATANRRIDELTERLHELLPRISESSHETRQAVESLHKCQIKRHEELLGFTERLTTMGTKTVQDVLAQAGSALSELQFQDPMIQSIEGIDHILTTTRKKVWPTSTDPVGHTYQPLLSEQLDADGETAKESVAAADAGELLLF